MYRTLPRKWDSVTGISRADSVEYWYSFQNYMDTFPSGTTPRGKNDKENQRMAFLVKISGTDVSFPADKGERILDAAERAGYDIPHA